MAIVPENTRGIFLHDHVSVSDLVRVHACPVRYFFERNDAVTESDRYIVCKQISSHLGNTLDTDVIWDEILMVRPSISPELREFLDTCITSCNKTEWKPAAQTDLRVISEKHGIVGMIDRVDKDGAFSIMRSTGAMPFGTYGADRLRIAACAFCLEEMTGKEVLGIAVEYIPDGVSRFHAVQPRDRRQVIEALRKTRAIRKGEMPLHPLNAPCNRCKYKERCESSVGRRLSELL